MNQTELEALIRLYLEKHVRPASEQKQVRKLLNEGRGSFIRRWEDLDGDWHGAVKESVMALTSDKGAAIRRYKLFIAWLKKNTTAEIHVEWPRVDVSSRIDRLVYIMRLLHEKPANIAAFLSEKLWMSERSVESELSSIQYDESVDNSFLGQSFRINGIARARGNLHFLSSVHPMLLMENLTSVAVMLQALLEKARSPACREWALLTACHAWNQLTAYAKGQVERVMAESYPRGDSVLMLFEDLKRMRPEESFLLEEEVRREAASQLMYGWKAGLQCAVTCREKDGSVTEVRGLPVGGFPQGDTVRLLLDSGEEISLPLDSILSSRVLQDEAGLQ